VCGNDVVEPGEECDDGNTNSEDGCSSACTSELIPGGGGAQDCFQEWLAPPVVVRDGEGMPSRRLVCRDDDPTCDHGAALGNQACTFHVALCFNVTDMRRFDPATGRLRCTGTELDSVRFASPDPLHPRDLTDELNSAALETALAGIGGAVRGQCVRATSGPRRVCGSDAECDSTPGKGDGACRGHFMAFDPPLSERDLCTEFADVVVPLRRTHGGRLRRGQRWIRLSARPTDDPHSGNRRTAGRDILKLSCDPAP